jgi:hypothetical protein
MKYITIPEDIYLGKDPEGNDVSQPFTAWLNNPLNGKPFGADGKALRMSLAIEKRFEGKKVGDVVHLADDEWEKLNAAAESPEGGFNTGPAKLFVPFMDAVADAVDTEPVTEALTE